MAKILLIEDDPLVVKMYRNVLSFEGFKIETSPNGAEGLQKAKEFLPDLIFLDIMMPKMNGIEVLEKLKKDPELKEIPVIMLTNLAGAENAEEALKKGAFAYMVKSEYKPKEVAQKAREFFGRKGIPVSQPAQQPIESAAKSQSDSVTQPADISSVKGDEDNLETTGSGGSFSTSSPMTQQKTGEINPYLKKDDTLEDVSGQMQTPTVTVPSPAVEESMGALDKDEMQTPTPTKIKPDVLGGGMSKPSDKTQSSEMDTASSTIDQPSMETKKSSVGFDNQIKPPEPKVEPSSGITKSSDLGSEPTVSTAPEELSKVKATPPVTDEPRPTMPDVKPDDPKDTSPAPMNTSTPPVSEEPVPTTAPSGTKPEDNSSVSHPGDQITTSTKDNT